MRDAFHQDLDSLSDRLVYMAHLAGSAVARATTALLDADVHLAESVIAADAQLDLQRQQLEALAVDLLARQQPVATDLRIVVTALRMSSDLERMGDLARHIAKVARLRFPVSPVPASMHAHVLEMGQVAERIVAKAGSVIASKDIRAAMQLEQDDDAMDQLHRQLFTFLARTSLATETVVDLTLLGRYYERFADHAVSLARRVIYLVTGEYHTDAAVDHETDEDPSTSDVVRDFYRQARLN